MALNAMDMMRGYEFWRDGCRMMAIAVCETLRMAKEPVTLENIVKFVSTLPRTSGDLTSESWQQKYCHKCLDKAVEAGSPEVTKLLADYFLVYFLDRTWLCQDTIIDAFIGILSGIDGCGVHCPHVTQEGVSRGQ